MEFRYKWKQIIIFFQISSETTRVVTAMVAAFDVPPQGLSLAGNLDLDTEIGCFFVYRSSTSKSSATSQCASSFCSEHHVKNDSTYFFLLNAENVFLHFTS